MGLAKVQRGGYALLNIVTPRVSYRLYFYSVVMVAPDEEAKRRRADSEPSWQYYYFK